MTKQIGMTRSQETAVARLLPPPYNPPMSTLRVLAVQYKLVLQALIADYRAEWVPQIILGLIMPIAFAFFAKAIGGAATHEQAIFVLGGNMTMSVALGPTAFLLFKIGIARQGKEFDFWITLPLQKIILVLGLISLGVLFSLPGLVGTYVCETWLLNLSFSGTWLLLLLVPLGVLPLASLGALLGSYAPSPQIAGLIDNILIAFVSFLSPMMIPYNALPFPLRILSWFVPTTYTADAFRAAIGGTIGQNVLIDIVVLSGFSIVFLVLVHTKLDWRSV
ncbi:ABC transporter permease [Tengunoibacter tsumagoiensis]|uniref:ABC-2 type transporter transmembrane domain-containing protein n=1 Tax=Tengunoibacter tsumagoiensis TaxID=2014871 RepID=A0A402A393_9CHLR|nr:ABC transporter permease [Tengunoibacter tsumagoiensis]GCE13506.1 hypothetical protein KTT_33650 [Tengunoibacter tsumagoiensis]